MHEPPLKWPKALQKDFRVTVPEQTHPPNTTPHVLGTIKFMSCHPVLYLGGITTNFITGRRGKALKGTMDWKQIALFPGTTYLCTVRACFQ